MTLVRWFGLAFLVLIINTFALGPFIMKLHPATGQFIYIIIRIGLYGGLGFIATQRYDRSLAQAAGAVMALALIEHVGFRAIETAIDPSLKPSEVTWAEYVYGLLFTYVMSGPLVGATAAVGAMLGRMERRPRQA